MIIGFYSLLPPNSIYYFKEIKIDIATASQKKSVMEASIRANAFFLSQTILTEYPEIG